MVVGWLAECNASGKGKPRDATPPDDTKEKYKDKISHTHSESVYSGTPTKGNVGWVPQAGSHGVFQYFT